MSETSAYLPVLCAAMKLMVACQRAETDDLLTTEPGLIPVREALREMEDVVERVEAKARERREELERLLDLPRPTDAELRDLLIFKLG
jgi:hypothetical protein